MRRFSPAIVIFFVFLLRFTDKSSFTMDETKKMTDRVVIVTGANSGVGYHTARVLADKDYDVILACRNEERAQEAVRSIKAGNDQAKVSYHLLDLANKASIDSFAAWFLSTGKPLYALVNNAGVLVYGSRETTKEGFEMTFGIIHLGHFLLTLLLLDKLKETAQELGEARIVHVGSGWHDKTNCDKTQWIHHLNVVPTDWDDLNLEKPGAYNWLQAYKNSKVAQLMFMKSLAKILEGTGVLSIAVSPGLVPSTSIFRHHSWPVRTMLYLVDNPLTRGYFGVKTMETGTQNMVDAVDSEKLKGHSGTFYKNFGLTEPNDEVRDEELQKRMWIKSCEMLDRDYKHLLRD